MNHFFKPLRAAAVAALGLAVLSGAALAQAPASLADHQAARVDNRQARQSERITHGVEQGSALECPSLLDLQQGLRLLQHQYHQHHWQWRWQRWCLVD